MVETPVQQDIPSKNGRVTIRKKTVRKKTVKKKTAKKKTAKATVRKKRKVTGKTTCGICGAGPFKNEVGLSVHYGKPKNRETHLGTKGKRNQRGQVQSQVTSKYGRVIDTLTGDWLDKASKSTKEVRDILLECVVELKLALR